MARDDVEADSRDLVLSYTTIATSRKGLLSGGKPVASAGQC